MDSAESTHYSMAMLPKVMMKWARTEAKKIKCLLDKKQNLGFPVLIYSGMSGINHAAYLSAALTRQKVSFGQIYVRKETEKSHGRPIEYTHNLNNAGDHFFIFVDDFISGGATLKNTVLKAMSIRCPGFMYTHLYLATQMGRFSTVLDELKKFTDKDDVILIYRLRNLSSFNKDLDKQFKEDTKINKFKLSLS